MEKRAEQAWLVNSHYSKPLISSLLTWASFTDTPGLPYDLARKGQFLASRTPAGCCLGALAGFLCDWLLPGLCWLLKVYDKPLALSGVASSEGRPGCCVLGMDSHGPLEAQGQHKDLAPRDGATVRRGREALKANRISFPSPPECSGTLDLQYNLCSNPLGQIFSFKKGYFIVF